MNRISKLAAAFEDKGMPAPVSSVYKNVEKGMEDIQKSANRSNKKLSSDQWLETWIEALSHTDKFSASTPKATSVSLKLSTPVPSLASKFMQRGIRKQQSRRLRIAVIDDQSLVLKMTKRRLERNIKGVCIDAFRLNTEDS